MVAIVVDCKENDIVDIKCGGPTMLGYDFFVKEEDVDATKELIKTELQKNNQPLLNITTREAPVNAKLWTPDMIKECIIRGY